VARSHSAGHVVALAFDSDFAPEVGKRFSFRGEPRPHWNGIIEGEVLSVDPERALSYTWRADRPNQSALSTVVFWTLTPHEQGGVTVRVEQAGFRSDDEMDGPRQGWDRLLARLAENVGAAS
jgi:uncharacterized protein YndB with AHSA1/START domain